jgi:Uma2 family endonuclease
MMYPQAYRHTEGNAMTTRVRFTTADLELLPDRLDDTRYEIIDGELYVAKQPSWHHQETCGLVFAHLNAWSRQSDAGRTTVAPGVLFAEDDNVAPDVVWVSKERLPLLLDEAGHLRGAPDLVVEVISPGLANEKRDREAKFKLYSRRGVLEYWIADRQLRQIEIYRREDAMLRLVATLHDTDVLQSPLLPGFACVVEELFP